MQGTLPSLEPRALSPELPLRSFASQKAATSKMSSLASEQLSGDSFRTSFLQGGVLRHQLAYLELTFAALAQVQKSLQHSCLADQGFCFRENKIKGSAFGSRKNGSDGAGFWLWFSSSATMTEPPEAPEAPLAAVLFTRRASSQNSTYSRDFRMIKSYLECRKWGV